MDFRQQQRNPAKHLVGLTAVVIFHVLLVYALVNGLAKKVVEVVKGPLETKIIDELKPPPEDAPPPPPPKLAPPPPPFIPPPEVNIAADVAPTGPTISVVTHTQPVAPPPPAAPAAVARTAPVIDAKRSCSEPEYPAISQRLGESGTVVLAFLIGIDGKVQDSRVQVSSGSTRLDEAARQAMARCKFKPGTVDGKAEASWANIKYTWRLQ